MNTLEASGDPEGGGSDDLTGRKKSRMKSLKSRVLGKIKRKEDDGGMKQTQSESDITLGVADSEDEYHHSQGMLGFRALSHDSVFLPDHHSDPEPPKVLSQENIHGKIRALQMKLQQQKLHLGPPPLLMPLKRPEDLGGSSEDDGLPHSPPEISCVEDLSRAISNKFPIPPKNQSTFSLVGTGSEEEEQSPSQPLSPRPISPAPAPLSPFAPSSGVDFSTPPQVTSLLDSSAARHRMSIKPKNQRASAKNKRVTPLIENRPRSESLNNLPCSLTGREEEEGLAFVKEIPRVRSYSSQILRPGEKLTPSQIKTPLPVSSLRFQQGSGDNIQASAESQHGRSILSTSPQSPGLKDLALTEPIVSSLGQEAATESKCISKSDEAQAAKPPVVPINRKEKVEEIHSSSKLIKNSQINLVSTVNPTLKPSVTASQEPSIKQDEKKYAVVKQTKIDTLSKSDVQIAVKTENGHLKDQHLGSSKVPANVICGVNLRPSSLRRNAPSADEKSDFKNSQPVPTMSAIGQEDNSQTESTKPQRPLSGSFHFTISSGTNYERPRTASFSGGVGQSVLKKEPPSPAKPPSNLKIEGQLSSQVEKTRKDSCANLPPESQKKDKAPTNPVIPTKFTDPAINQPHTQDVEESQDTGMQEIGVEATEEEVQEEVEEAEEAGEDVTEDVKKEQEKEATSAFGVKLRSTSLSLKFRLDKAQSELKVKQNTTEIGTLTPPLGSQLDSTDYKEPEDHCTRMGSMRENRAGTIVKNPPLCNTKTSTSTATPTTSPPKSVCEDKERAGLLRQADPPQPSCSSSKAGKIEPSLPKGRTDLPPKETTAVPLQENTPTTTASEVSWMEMAREKTRTLQQLFTSRLPEFPGLQTTTRPTTLSTTQPQTQTSTSQVNSRTMQNITSKQTAAQPPERPSETTAKQLPSLQSSGRSTQAAPVQTPASQPSDIQIFSKPTQTTTSQPQDDSPREVLIQSKSQICNSTSKQNQSTVTCTSNMQSTTQTTQTAKQPWIPPTSQIQQSSPQRTGIPQASQTSEQSILHPTQGTSYPHLSSSPKLTSHMVFLQSANTVSKDQPQSGGNEPSMTSGKADRGPVQQGKGNGVEDAKPIWAVGLGNKTSLVQRWESQTTSATKAGEQKATPELRTTPQSSVPPRPISKLSGTDTELDPKASVSSVPMRSTDREDKWQKKSIPPSSSPSSPSPLLQSVSDSGQPSWMELAKRKSLAWSDKTMD